MTSIAHIIGDHVKYAYNAMGSSPMTMSCCHNGRIVTGTAHVVDATRDGYIIEDDRTKRLIRVRPGELSLIPKDGEA